MYKIYINDSPLLFLDKKEEARINEFGYIDPLVHKFHRGQKGLFNYIDILEKQKNTRAIALIAEAEPFPNALTAKQLFKKFKELYLVIPASGGIVENEEGDILAIFRRGRWDLPKGKIEQGEKKKAAGVREVEEETGIKNIVLKKKLGKTYHTFKNKQSNRSLKVSHWYHMESPKQELIPQLEEDIERATWISPHDFINTREPIYPNIKDIVSKFLRHKAKLEIEKEVSSE